MDRLAAPWGSIPYERDRWGYPTIHARDEREAVWARGFLHATDRRMQVELTRLIGEGRALELLGDAPFARRIDRTVRALGLTRGLDAAVHVMEPGLRAWMQAYADGFDAGAAARRGPWPLRLLGVEDRRWTVRDVLLVHRVLAWFGLTSTSQLSKAVVAELLALGCEEDALRALLGPGGDGLDVEAARAVDWAKDDALLGVPVIGGSNAFAIAGARSASGGAIVLAEFHMDVARIPPVLYAVDVRYDDGRYVCGMTVPGQPHVHAGRTDRVAWAYTFGHADNIDVTVERVDGRDVVVGDRREPLHEEVEEVKVRGGRAERWTFRRLPTGVAVLGTGDGDHPAARWRGLEDAISDHEVLRGLLDARDVDELVALHRRVRTLSVAAVLGDADGRIAWVHTGVIARDRAGWGPRRRGADDPEAEEARRPVVVDPEEGLLGSANEGVPGWTAFPEPSYRKDRLMERLRARDTWDLDAAAQVTHDEHDPCAERLMAAWAPLLPDVPEARTLAAWAAAQALVDPETGRRERLRFHRLHLEATRSLLGQLLGRDAGDLVLDGLGLHMTFQPGADDLLAGGGAPPLDPDLLRQILREAWRTASWDWSGPSSAVDAVAFTHVLEQGRLPAFLGLSTRPIRMPGGPTSLFQTRQVPFLGEIVVGGPAFRMAMDLGRSGARYVVAGGASERRLGPGYAAGLDAWAKGELAPIGPLNAPPAPRAPSPSSPPTTSRSPGADPGTSAADRTAAKRPATPRKRRSKATPSTS